MKMATVGGKAARIHVFHIFLSYWHIFLIESMRQTFRPDRYQPSSKKNCVYAVAMTLAAESSHCVFHMFSRSRKKSSHSPLLHYFDFVSVSYQSNLDESFNDAICFSKTIICFHMKF